MNVNSSKWVTGLKYSKGVQMFLTFGNHKKFVCLFFVFFEVTTWKNDRVQAKFIGLRFIGLWNIY